MLEYIGSSMFSLFAFVFFEISLLGNHYASGEGSLNFPSWFIIPQKLAGYPLYMPQEPVFAAGGSSDFVNGWGDYRFNNFYDQTVTGEPDVDPLYDNFQTFLAGKPLPNATGTTAAPAAAAADQAAEDRPARQFTDSTRRRRSTTTPMPTSDGTSAELLRLFSKFLSSVTASVNPPKTSDASDITRSQNDSISASVIIPSLTKLDAAANAFFSRPSTTRKSTQTREVPSTLPVTTTVPFPVQTQEALTIHNREFMTNTSVEFLPERDGFTGNKSTASKMYEDLFQLAFAWPPLSVKRGMLALPTQGTITPSPFQVLQAVTRGASISEENAESSSNTLGSLNAATRGGNRNFNSFDFGRNLTHMQKLLVPAYLADFAVSHVLGREMLQQSGFRNTSFNANHIPTSADEVFPSQVVAFSSTPSMIVSSDSSSSDLGEAQPLRSRLETMTLSPTASTMAIAMQQHGDACIILLTNNQQRVGVCVDNAALVDECDGMGIKKSHLCSSNMSCCFNVAKK